ncbi:DUF4352 domain-containing protein [Cellulosimicrobium funkei]|nr:DUF4352 domain-containing protein [Cellulosimicrobium funkei]
MTATATVTAEPDAESSTDAIAETEEQADITSAVVGDPVDHAGVRLTVTSAKASDTVTRNVTNSRQGSGYEEYDEIPADEGGRYIVVEAEVENIGKKSMDLTCSWPVNIMVIDREMREFDTIDSLYEIKGNPECNAELQPGFSNTITYAFMVPNDSKVPGLYFQDTNFLEEEPAVVSFGSDL